MIWMDVDTALSEVPVNYAQLVDDTDFKTREESVTYDQAGMDLVWNFVTTAGAFTQTAVTPTTGGDYDWSNKGNGMYTIEIPASGGASINNDAEGFGWFSGYATGILPWIGPIIGFRAAGLNDKAIDNAYDTNRGFAGTGLPAADADAAGGLPVSDAGGLDLDSKLANTNEVTAARMGALTDWLNGGRLDLLLDAIKVITDQINFTGIYVNAQVKAKDNIDFGALEKASLNAATPSVTVSDKTGFSLSAAGVQAIWDALTSALTTVGSIGKKLADWVVGTIDTYTGNTKQTGDAYAIVNNVTYGNSALNTDLDAIISSLVTIAGYVDELETRLTAVRAGYLDNLSVGAVALEATLTAIKGAGWTNENLTTIDSIADAIKVVTDILAGLYENVSGYRFTEKALEQAPSGTGGDATETNQEDIIDKLKGLMSKAHTLSSPVGNFDPADDSNEAIRDRGDSAWITGSGLSGSNAVTLTIQDDDGNNIVEAAVEIWDSAGTTFYERKTTDSGGQTTHDMDDGTYTVKIHKAGYTFSNQTLVVDGTEAETYTGTAVNIGTPSAANVCRVYEYVTSPDDADPDSVTATAKIISLPYDYGGKLFSGQEVAGIYADGIIYWDIVYGAEAEFVLADFGISTLTKTIPSTSTARLYDIT